MDIDAILASLGGPAVVADALECGVSAISNWKTRGIPSGRKYDLIFLAQKKGVPLSIADIETAAAAITASHGDTA